MLEHVASLRDAVSIPVLANGNSRTHEDVQHNLRLADGVMSGVGILRNPQ